MKAVDPHLEGVKPLFDQVSIGVFNPTVQFSLREGSPMTELIDGKRGLGEIVLLTGSSEKGSHWIGAMSFKQLDINYQFCLDLPCNG